VENGVSSEDSYFKRGPRVLNDHFTIDPNEFPLWNLSYSMAGEDLVVRALLKGELREGRIGFYADVGCFDARYGSNSYLLYRYGWSGICVDANPKVAPLYGLCRPRDVFVHAAVGEEGTGYWGRMATAAASAVARTQAELPKDCKEILTLPFVPLKKLFDQHKPAAVPLDVMFMDIEGGELSALKSNDWNNYRPRIIVIEVNDMDAENLTASAPIGYLRNLGYKIVGAVFPNVFLVSN
jgi:hypothetical protein